LVLNHPTGKKVGEILTDPEFSALANIRVFAGGPVGRDHLTFAALWAEGDYFGYSTRMSAEQAIQFTKKPGAVVHAFIGYSGWARINSRTSWNPNLGTPSRSPCQSCTPPTTKRFGPSPSGTSPPTITSSPSRRTISSRTSCDRALVPLFYHREPQSVAYVENSKGRAHQDAGKTRAHRRKRRETRDPSNHKGRSQHPD